MKYTFRTASNLAIMLYSPDDLMYILEVLKPSKYAYILHDKDLTENNQPKPSHYHLCVVFACPMSAENFSQISGNFKENVFVENVHSQKAFESYLTHKNAPHKYQYDNADVVSNYKWYNAVKDRDGVDTETLLNEIIETEYTLQGLRAFWRKNHRLIFSSKNINAMIELIGVKKVLNSETGEIEKI